MGELGSSTEHLDSERVSERNGSNKQSRYVLKGTNNFYGVFYTGFSTGNRSRFS